MEHPFINELDKLSLEEIQTKISELSGKLNFVSRMGNEPLMNQLNMAIESYRSAYSKKMSDMMNRVTTTVKIEKSNGS